MQDLIRNAVECYYECHEDYLIADTFASACYNNSDKFNGFKLDEFNHEVVRHMVEYEKEEKEYILITGATGYLGNHFLKRLIDNHPNEKILILTRRFNLPRISENVEYILSSMIDVFDLDPRLKKVKEVYHFAAYVKHDDTPNVWEESLNSNVIATIMMYFLAYFNRAKFVYLSTSGTVAFHSDDASLMSRMPYYASKRDIEEIMNELCQLYPIHGAIIRPSMMLGPKVNLFGLKNIYERNILEKIKNHTILFSASGIVNFVDVRYVTDLCYCVYKMNLDTKFLSLNAMGPNMNMGDFFAKVSEINGWTKYYIPNTLAYLFTFVGIISKTEYEMTNIGWYYRCPDRDEFLKVCKQEHNMTGFKYYEVYPIEQTLVIDNKLLTESISKEESEESEESKEVQ